VYRGGRQNGPPRIPDVALVRREHEAGGHECLEFDGDVIDAETSGSTPLKSGIVTRTLCCWQGLGVFLDKEGCNDAEEIVGNYEAGQETPREWMTFHCISTQHENTVCEC
jgi:hypothetical protein